MGTLLVVTVRQVIESLPVRSWTTL